MEKSEESMKARRRSDLRRGEMSSLIR